MYILGCCCSRLYKIVFRITFFIYSNNEEDNVKNADNTKNILIFNYFGTFYTKGLNQLCSDVVYFGMFHCRSTSSDIDIVIDIRDC